MTQSAAHLARLHPFLVQQRLQQAALRRLGQPAHDRARGDQCLHVLFVLARHSEHCPSAPNSGCTVGCRVGAFPGSRSRLHVHPDGDVEVHVPEGAREDAHVRLQTTDIRR